MRFDRVLTQFKDLFSEIPGRAKDMEIEIRTGDNPPVHLPAYRVPLQKHQVIRDEVEEMLKAGVIQPSKSPWASPVVLVQKPDGKWRVCIDYRKLNKISVPDPYPMPRIEEMLDRLRRAEYITTLDFTKGYWQIPVSKESQAKTAFLTPIGKYEFPFGLASAPSVFQRYVNTILADTQLFAAAYIDDMQVYSESWEDHMRHLKIVLTNIKESGLTIKLKKCKWAQHECEFRVGQGKIRG